MNVRIAFFGATLISASAFATEPPPATQPPAASTTVAAEDEGLICERVAEAGSLARKRKICTTRAQREQAVQDNKEMLNDMSRRVAPDKSD